MEKIKGADRRLLAGNDYLALIGMVLRGQSDWARVARSLHERFSERTPRYIRLRQDGTLDYSGSPAKFAVALSLEAADQRSARRETHRLEGQVFCSAPNVRMIGSAVIPSAKFPFEPVLDIDFNDFLGRVNQRSEAAPVLAGTEAEIIALRPAPLAPSPEAQILYFKPPTA